MQKIVPPNTGSSNNSCGKTTLIGNIFQTMAYNENQVENFSTILKWISSNGDKISSVLNGSRIESPPSCKTTFAIGQKIVSVVSLDAKILESIVASVKYDDTGSKQDSWDEKGALERLEKFERLMKTLGPDLCALESIACAVPAWQIAEYDQASWNIQNILAHDVSFTQARRAGERTWREGKVLHLLMKLRRENYCLGNLLPVIMLGVLSEGKFILSISLKEAEDSSCIFPAAYLLDAVNKANIRKLPMDLLILNESMESEKALISNTVCSKIMLWNDCNKSLSIPYEIVEGVTKSENVRSVHYIVDSSADIQSAVDSIAVSAWCSGSHVNLRARSLVFIHQPVYTKVIEFFEQKISSLRISSDPREKSNDFITCSSRGMLGAADLKKILAFGVKIAPKTSSLIGPTILYDIGTSTDFVANKAAGLGHILCAIPYRSNTELLSLANNYGSCVQTQIFASNSAVVKKLTLNIKGDEIWVNSSGKYNGEEKGLTNINDWILLQPSSFSSLTIPPSTTTSQLKQHLQTEKDVLAAAEKASKSWSTVGMDSRFRIAERAMESVWEKNNKKSDSGCLLDLMRITQKKKLENELEEFTILRTNPVGIVAIVVVNPEKISLSSLILSIMFPSTLGNTTIVISSLSPMPSSIVEACNSNFPVGVVNFINSSAPTIYSLKEIQKQGKIDALLIIQDGKNGIEEIEGLRNVNTFIMCQNDSIREANSILSTASLFENIKIIHL